MGNNDFIKDLESCINRHCQENESNTPDYILAEFLNECLRAWNTAVQQREKWYGRDFYTGSITERCSFGHVIFTIVVNGEEKEVYNRELSYRDVVDLAASSDEEKRDIFSITYRKAAGEKQEGILSLDDVVFVKDGTIFSAFVTSDA